MLALVGQVLGQVEAQGVQAGDVMVSVDGTLVAGMDQDAIIALITRRARPLRIACQRTTDQ